MNELIMYFAKSSGVLLLFLGLYFLVLRKETFFNENRFFLLGGMILSLVVPFFVITKYIEIPTVLSETNGAFVFTETNVTQETNISWTAILLYTYVAGVLFFFCKFLIELFSLFKLLGTSKVSRRDEQFIYIETTSSFSPFSFFNYIVYNPKLYSESELTAILKHEQAHSRQLHSIDVFVAKLYCIFMWFNPFAWLHKKFMLQNLEFLADSAAIKQTPSKKEYQLTLLKVSGNTYCPALTNNFYNSLIKKRIVMLQKTQSTQLNRWKQVLIFPMLIAFIFMFNTEVIAKEINTTSPTPEKETIIEENTVVGDLVVVITKNTSIDELRAYKKMFSSQGIKFKYSDVDFNSNKEITAIKLDLKQGKNNTASATFESSENKPIPNIKVGKKGKQLIISSSMSENHVSGTVYEFHSDEGHDGKDKKVIVRSNYSTGDNNNNNNNNNVWVTKGNVKTVDIKKVDGKEVIIVNGKEVSADEIIENEINIKKDDGNTFTYSFSSDDSDEEREHSDIEVKILENHDNKVIINSSNSKEKPLVIIDGKEASQEEFTKLDSDKIATVSVLKGESATKLYGKKGENGVIVIETKKKK